MNKQVEFFRGNMLAAAHSFRNEVFSLVEMFVEDLNQADDKEAVLSAFLGAFEPIATNRYDGVVHSDSDVLPGVEIYFAPDGADIGVYVGGEQRDYVLNKDARSVVRRLVEVGESYNSFWSTAEGLYNLLKGDDAR